MRSKIYLLFLTALFTFLFTSFQLSAQTTITTTGFLNNNANATITFNLRNNNATGIILTDIASICSSAGLKDVSAYFKTSAINGLPGPISAANGWNQFGSAVITGIANTTTTVTQPFMSGLSLLIPGGATYGICVQAVNQGTTTAALRYSTVAAGLYTFSGGGVDMLAGTNISYGGVAVPGAPTFTPRAFIGSVTFVSAVSCATPTAQPTGLVLTAVGLQQIDGSFTAAVPPSTNYLVIRYPAGATPTAPVNGASYTVGAALGTGTVVSNGTGTTFSATGLAPGTSYDFYVYSFNGGLCSGAYLTAGPLFGNRSTNACSGPPTITCPANITVSNGAGLCGANVTYPAATVTGTPTPTITYSIASGSFFPVGTTTVTATATSICGTANCTFTVRVNDTQGPSFGNPTPERLYYRFDGSGASVPNLASAPPAGTATASIQGGQSQGGTGICSGSLIGSGVTSTSDYLNTGWVTDLTGTSWTISFKTANIGPSTTLFYILGDNTAGSFRCFTNGVAGANNWMLRGTGITDIIVPGGATVAPHTTTFVYDNVSGNLRGYLDGTLLVTVAQAPVTTAGTGPFKVGGYGANTGLPLGGQMDEFRLYTRALSGAEVLSLAGCPLAPCPANIVVNNAPGICGAVVTYSSPVGGDNCSGTTTTQVAGLASGSTFPVGLTTNTFRATDAAGNITNCTFTVRVNDTQAPTITCPANMTVSTPVGSCTAIVTYTPTVTDNCPGATFVATPASGSVFNLGTTPVTVIATDASGNTSTCTFNVTVLDGQLPVMSVPPSNRTVCLGTSAVFGVTASNVVTYQWQAWNGTAFANIAGANSSTYTVANVTSAMNTNSYRVILTGLCTTITSNHVSLFVNLLPTVAIVASKPPQLLPGEFVNLSTSVNPGGGTYAWFKNGTALTGITGSAISNLSVKDAGVYRVVYTDANGCVATSADLTVSALTSDHLWVYPNPNRGDFRVRFNNLPNENVWVNVYDAKGSKVYQRQYTTGLTYSELDVSISKMPIGRYLVEAVNGSGNRVGAKWVIIEH